MKPGGETGSDLAHKLGVRVPTKFKRTLLDNVTLALVNFPDVEVVVLECCVREAEAKGETGGNLFRQEVAIVDVELLDVIDLWVRRLRGVDKVDLRGVQLKLLI